MFVAKGGAPTFRVRLVKLDVWRNGFVLQRKDSFNDRAEARCALRMTYIRLELFDINVKPLPHSKKGQSNVEVNTP